MPSGKKRQNSEPTVQGATLLPDQLNLWLHKPSHLRTQWLLALTEGTATPLPMDCLRLTMDLWIPDLDEYIEENRAEITDSWTTRITTMCPSLTSINLTDCLGVSDAGIEALAAACPSLVSLSLRINRKIGMVTDIGIKAIAASCPLLTTLDAGGTEVTDKGIKAIAASCPALTSLNVSRTEVTEEGIKAIATSCPLLTSLDISRLRCPAWTSVTDEGMRAITKSCPKVVIIRD